MIAERWRYGDSHERYPIIPGVTWRHHPSKSAVAVVDIRNGLPSFMRGSLVYSDPPWSTGNVNSFITKAGRTDYIPSFDVFVAALARAIDAVGSAVCYLEIGRQNEAMFRRLLAARYTAVQAWPITYYRRSPCMLLRGGAFPTETDFTGRDDEETPAIAIATEQPEVVVDLCTGRGLTLLAAHAAGRTFFGTELNQRRLAVAIDRAARKGVRYSPDPVAP